MPDTCKEKMLGEKRLSVMGFILKGMSSYPVAVESCYACGLS